MTGAVLPADTASLADVLDVLPVAVLVIDTAGIIAHANAPATALWATDLLVGRPLADLLPPSYYPDLPELLAPDGQAQVELYLPEPGRWLQLAARPLGTGHVALSAQDITTHKQTQNQYYTLVENTYDALTRWDQRLRLVYANDAAARKTHLGLPAEVAGPFTAALAKVFASAQPATHYTTLPTPEGDTHFQTRLVPELVDGQVHTVLAITRDITSLRQAENQAQEHGHLLASIVQATPDLLYVIEVTGPHILYINDRARDVLGLTPAEVYSLGKELFSQYLHPDDRERRLVQVASATLLTDDEVLTQEVRLRHADHTYHWMQLRNRAFRRGPDGRVTHIIGIGHDIQPQKSTAEELQRKNSLLQGVFGASTSALCVLTSVRNDAGAVVDFQIQLINPVIERFLGNVVGHRYLTYFPAAAHEDLFGWLAETVATGEPLLTEVLYTGDGLSYWLRVHAVRLDDGLVVTFENITGQKKAQAAQLVQRQQLTEAVLAAEEGEKRRIAESLHNGLAQLLYAAKLSLDQRSPAPAEAAGHHKTSDLLVAAINQTRTLAHELMPRTLEDFGLAAALQDICVDFSVAPLRMRSQVIDLPAQLSPPLTLALYRISQELANNIVKHARATQATLCLRGLPRAIELTAVDNGIGFEPEHVATRGLGLQVLHNRVRLLNGTLTVRSAPQQGTTITVVLPTGPTPT